MKQKKQSEGETRTPVETAAAYMAKEARLVAKVADPETREVLNRMAEALKDPARVAAFIGEMNPAA